MGAANDKQESRRRRRAGSENVMPDNDDPEWPNSGKALLLRMSKIDREMLDRLCERTGLNPSDAVRAAIRLAHNGLLKPKDMELQGFKWITYENAS
jgi:hypothetical protein